MPKISALPEATEALADTDEFAYVDKSDTTGAATGTTKREPFSRLKEDLEDALTETVALGLTHVEDVTLSTSASAAGPAMTDLNAILWLEFDYSRLGSDVRFITLMRKADVGADSSNPYPLQLQGAGGSHLDIYQAGGDLTFGSLTASDFASGSVAVYNVTGGGTSTPSPPPAATLAQVVSALGLPALAAANRGMMIVRKQDETGFSFQAVPTGGAGGSVTVTRVNPTAEQDSTVSGRAPETVWASSSEAAARTAISNISDPSDGDSAFFRLQLIASTDQIVWFTRGAGAWWEVGREEAAASRTAGVVYSESDAPGSLDELRLARLEVVPDDADIARGMTIERDGVSETWAFQDPATDRLDQLTRDLRTVRHPGAWTPATSGRITARVDAAGPANIAYPDSRVIAATPTSDDPLEDEVNIYVDLPEGADISRWRIVIDGRIDVGMNSFAELGIGRVFGLRTARVNTGEPHSVSLQYHSSPLETTRFDGALGERTLAPGYIERAGGHELPDTETVQWQAGTVPPVLILSPLTFVKSIVEGMTVGLDVTARGGGGGVRPTLTVDLREPDGTVISTSDTLTADGEAQYILLDITATTPVTAAQLNLEGVGGSDAGAFDVTINDILGFTGSSKAVQLIALLIDRVNGLETEMGITTDEAVALINQLVPPAQRVPLLAGHGGQLVAANDAGEALIFETLDQAAVGSDLAADVAASHKLESVQIYRDGLPAAESQIAIGRWREPRATTSVCQYEIYNASATDVVTTTIKLVQVREESVNTTILTREVAVQPASTVSGNFFARDGGGSDRSRMAIFASHDHGQDLQVLSGLLLVAE